MTVADDYLKDKNENGGRLSKVFIGPCPSTLKQKVRRELSRKWNSFSEYKKLRVKVIDI